MINRFLLSFTSCLIVYLLTFSLATAEQSRQVKAMPDDQLLLEIIKLDIGLEEYRIGKRLTEKQLKKANENSIKNRYQGTMKFKDGDVGVVADASTKNILALYLENKDADKDQTKNMVGTLMMAFGQPTTMAHEKIVYWAYNKNGLISEDEHSKAKSIDDMNILATVKFNSKTRFMDSKEGEAKKNDIYCIVSSPALLERFSKK